jgi:tRNA(Ile)-lysidine synthetase-like protein
MARHPVLDGAPLLIAHRGGSGLAPENTLAAFRTGVETWGADMVELDVHASRDGHCVVIHDPTVDRTTDGTGAVADMTLAELRELDAGYRFTPDGGSGHPFRGRGVTIPSIEEVLEAFPHLRIIVEVKTGAAQAPLFAAIRRFAAHDRVIAAGMYERDRTMFGDYTGAISAASGELRRFYILHRLRLGRWWPPRAHVVQMPEEWEGTRLLTPRLVRDLTRQRHPRPHLDRGRRRRHGAAPRLGRGRHHHRPARRAGPRAAPADGPAAHRRTRAQRPVMSDATGGGTPLAERFARHRRGATLLRSHRRVVVALSGGLDSVCLLHLLRFGDFELELHAAHYDHGMRPDSAGDAAWVRGLCAAWDVPLHTDRAAAPPRGEAAARDLRYAFLHDVAARTGADAIVTAHHADDQAETVLFRLARGTGLRGLAGIPPRRGLLVRPLLPFTRVELQAHATRAGLRWREDRTNLDVRFARNRIRHVVLPALEAARPGAARRIARLARHAAAAERGWSAIVADALEDVLIDTERDGFALARERLLAYHPHIRARVVRYLLHELGSEPGRAGTRSAAEFISSGLSGGRIELPGGVRLEREFDRLLLRRRGDAAEPDAPLEIDGAGEGSGRFRVGGQAYAACWGAGPMVPETASAASFDPTSLRFPLVLRGWRPGDRIRLAYGSKKLKKLFQEHRIGRGVRGRTPVLADAAGRVLWVVGIARSGEALPQDDEAFTLMVMDGESL